MFSDELGGLEQDVTFAQEQTRDALAADAPTSSHELAGLADAFMSKIHMHLITSRLLAAQHHKISTLVSPKQSETFTDGRTCLYELATYTAEDCRAFCISKNSEAPEVRVTRAFPGQGGGFSTSAVIMEGHIHFIFMELLKNSMKAMLDRYGSNILDAPPIEVMLSGQGNELGIKVSDTGGGIPASHRHRAMDFFYTTHVEREANYTYSKDFGAKFTGYGVGLPMARLYARIAGGDLGLSVLPGHGTDAILVINRHGTGPIPDE